MLNLLNGQARAPANRLKRALLDLKCHWRTQNLFRYRRINRATPGNKKPPRTYRRGLLEQAESVLSGLFYYLFIFDFGLRSVHQLHKRHRRLVTGAKTALEDPNIAAWSLLVSGTQLLKQLAHRGFGARAVKGQTPIGNAVLFGQRYQRLGIATQLLSPWARSS